MVKYLQSLENFNSATDLKATHFSGIDFSKMDLTLADFRASYLYSCSFEGSNLWGANFNAAEIKGCIFKEAKLDNAYFKGATCSNNNFEKASLKNINFICVDFTNNDFTDALFENVEFHLCEKINNKFPDIILPNRRYFKGNYLPFNRISLNPNELAFGCLRKTLNEWIENADSLFELHYKRSDPKQDELDKNNFKAFIDFVKIYKENFEIANEKSI